MRVHRLSERLRLSYMYFHKSYTSQPIHTPMTFDLHVRTVITLASLSVPLLSSVDVVPLVKTAGVVENSGHCIYSIGLKCHRTYALLFHLLIYRYIYICV